MIGQVIGTYKIQRKLGEGGMGAVYMGVDTMLDREVAIKALRPELARQTAIVERFRSEAVTLAKLNHPNIATLYSLFRQGDELYMVLEYVRGETLDQILARRGALPTDEVIPVFCQILDGINHAHEYGIIHRDIKPANMMLTETGVLKVLDFGIARLLGTDRMTRAGNIIGTLEYMAPEQVKGLETDARSDTYALGMMLYEILTGRTPFATDNEFELMKLQTESLPPLPRSIVPSIPESVEAAIIRAIQKDPDQRFQTAGDFREFLLDAGFLDEGSLRRTTGPRRRISAPGTASPVSASEAPAITAESDAIIKETRLAPPAAAPAYSSDVKETRLGNAGALYQPGPFGDPEEAPAASSPSFFDRLTWVHYAGAGSVLAVLLVFFFVVPIVIFSGVFSQEAEEPPANSPAPNKDAVVITTPSPEPVAVRTPEPIRAPVAVSTPEPEPTPVFTPVETPEPVERGKIAPPAKKNPPAPKKTPAKPRSKSLREARCALTGDC